LGNTRHNTADPEAVKLLAKYGDTLDAEKLLEAARRSYGETQNIAFEAALRLGQDKEEILEIMVNEGRHDVAAQAAEHLWRLNQEKLKELAKGMLRVDEPEKRLRGLAILVLYCEKDALEDLLEEYIGGKSYYYNVVTWMDRTLYAPGRYREYFKKELLENH
jgi:hypothetical protein